MWIREKLDENKKDRFFGKGRVTSSGKDMRVSGEENLRQPEIIAPFGFYFVLPESQAVISAEAKLVGVPMECPAELKAGEILIKNAFGAEIKLCDDGAVIVNGQRFERREN